MTGSTDGRTVAGGTRRGAGADRNAVRRESSPPVVVEYEQIVRRAEAEAEKARARLAAVVGSLR